MGLTPLEQAEARGYYENKTKGDYISFAQPKLNGLRAVFNRPSVLEQVGQSLQ